MDKAKVEVGVQVVERWILAMMRNRQSSSLGELNTAIELLLDRLTSRSFLAHAARLSRPSTNLHCNRYQNIPVSTPNGKR